jgi:hypothetical protein
MNGLLTTDQIRDLAKQVGLDSARRLAEATGVSIGTCHKLLAAEPGKPVLHEESLVRFTQFFQQAIHPAEAAR